MIRWIKTGQWVLMLAICVPVVVAILPLAWTLRGARAALRTIKPGHNGQHPMLDGQCADMPSELPE